MTTDATNVTGDYIRRSEYEARHAELRVELMRLSTEHDSHFKWVVAENEKMRNDVQTKFDILATKIDLQAKSIDSAGVGVWKLVAASVINFMLGGGLIALLNYLHFPR